MSCTTNQLYLWGVNLYCLIVSGVFFALAAIMSWCIALVYLVVKYILAAYKKNSWYAELLRMKGWTVATGRWGFFWGGFFYLTFPPQVWNVLQYIVPLPFVLCLFFWVDSVTETISRIGKLELKHRADIDSYELSTKITGFTEILRIIKYIGMILVFFVLLVVLNVNVPWLKNLAGGMVLFYDRKYIIENDVGFAGVSGTVKDITLRFTTLERNDQSLCIIPNGRLLEQPVINYSKRNVDVIFLKFKLDPHDDTENVKDLIRELESSLEILNPALNAKPTHGQKGGGTHKTFSVGVEGEYELAVRSYAKREKGLTKEQANLALKNLTTDMVINISEQMLQHKVHLRNSVDKKNVVTLSLLGLDPTNDDDMDMTTSFIALLTTNQNFA